MRAALLALAAISALAVAADAAAKTPPALKGWIAAAADQVGHAAEPAAAPAQDHVLVSAEVESNRRLSAARIVRSSGSRDVDEAVITAVKQIRLKGSTPAQLVNRRVILRVPLAAAETQTAALPQSGTN